MSGPLADVARDDFLRGVVEELKPANERWPGLWTRLESLLNERDRLERHVQDMEKALDFIARRRIALEAFGLGNIADVALAALPAREKGEE